MAWSRQGTARPLSSRLTANKWIKNRQTALFVALFAAIGGFVLLNASSAETQPVSMYLTPDMRTISPNTEFSLQLRVNSGAVEVDAVQAEINYPAEMMQLLGIETGDSKFKTEGPGRSSEGEVVISRGAEGGVTGDLEIATLRFRSLAVSTPSAAVSFQGNNYIYESDRQQDVLGGVRATRGAILRIDGQPPMVTLLNPTASSVIRAGTTVPVQFEATDRIATVTRVEFYVNNVKTATLDEPPYTFNWKTAGFSVGSRHTLHAQAVDSHGNVGASQTLTVTLGR